ncbi:hypothetical protein HWV62_33978 [Athelia sp. TMB]|nr:hypothetical protein HWV62_33978 [Athelia sp. TMB]
MAHAHESCFGPPSNSIDIARFIQSAKELEASASQPVFLPSHKSVSGFEVMEQLPLDFNESIQEECSVADIKSSVENVLNNPTLYAHITKTHDTNVYIIHEHADKSSRRKRKRPGMLDPANEPPAVTALQKTLDAIQLKSWQYMLDSALFMRPPKNSDQNVLISVKESLNALPDAVDPLAPSNTAVVLITVHNRLAWSQNMLTRSSQHALLASQTLGDLFEAIQCVSNEIPDELLADGDFVGYDTSKKAQGSSGCVICIEGSAYGDGMSESDYAE